MKTSNIRSIAFLGLVAAVSSLPSRAASAFPVVVSEAPTDNLSLTVGAIKSAKQSLYMNIYEFTSSEIADAVLDRIQNGVTVQIIEEGQPVGGLATAAVGIQDHLTQAMNAAGKGDRFFEMTSKASGGKRRYRYDHAKYAVIDGTTLLIGSENYSPTGNPEPNTLGNRGWEVLIGDAAIAQEFMSIFTADSDTSHGDILSLGSGPQTVALSDPGSSLTDLFMSTPGAAKKPVKPRPCKRNCPPQPQLDAPSPVTPVSPEGLATLEASAVQRVTSPDTSLSGLVGLVNSARTSLDIEQMTFDKAWGNQGGQSPLFDAVVAAVKRGVKVRVLLNDESVFDHPGHPAKRNNEETVTALNQLGQQVSAMICNRKAMGVDYIHNKGVLVDGELTLISSINWDQNSVTNNREAAVIITSPAVFSHYEALFEKDWQASSGKSPTTVIPSQNLEMNLPALDPVSDDESLGTESAVVCPEMVRVIASISKLDLSDLEDSSFSSLSNQKLDANVARERNSRGCVLTDSTDLDALGVKSHKYLQIRGTSNGVTTVAFEGYTSKNKLYSIRASIPSGKEMTGHHAANFYDGSGPSRRKLGTAILELNIVR